MLSAGCDEDAEGHVLTENSEWILEVCQAGEGSQWKKWGLRRRKGFREKEKWKKREIYENKWDMFRETWSPCWQEGMFPLGWRSRIGFKRQGDSIKAKNKKPSRELHAQSLKQDYLILVLTLSWVIMDKSLKPLTWRSLPIKPGYKQCPSLATIVSLPYQWGTARFPWIVQERKGYYIS